MRDGECQGLAVVCELLGALRLGGRVELGLEQLGEGARGGEWLCLCLSPAMAQHRRPSTFSSSSSGRGRQRQRRRLQRGRLPASLVDLMLLLGAEATTPTSGSGSIDRDVLRAIERPQGEGAPG